MSLRVKRLNMFWWAICSIFFTVVATKSTVVFALASTAAISFTFRFRWFVFEDLAPWGWAGACEDSLGMNASLGVTTSQQSIGSPFEASTSCPLALHLPIIIVAKRGWFFLATTNNVQEQRPFHISICKDYNTIFDCPTLVNIFDTPIETIELGHNNLHVIPFCFQRPCKTVCSSMWLVPCIMQSNKAPKCNIILPCPSPWVFGDMCEALTTFYLFIWFFKIFSYG